MQNPVIFLAGQLTVFRNIKYFRKFMDVTYRQLRGSTAMKTAAFFADRRKRFDLNLFASSSCFAAAHAFYQLVGPCTFDDPVSTRSCFRAG